MAKVNKGSTNSTKAAVTTYWVSVMNDTKQKPQRRDRAAKELFKLISIQARMKNSRRKIAAMHRRAEAKEAKRLRAGGKKAARKEHAAETAQGGGWSGLIPKAKVLAFARK